MTRWLLAVSIGLLVPVGGAAENLCVNGSFDAKDDPLKGWNYDYRWTGNENYAANYTRVSAVDRDGVRRHVLRIAATDVLETKVESTPIPFESGGLYRCTLYAKGGPARIYLAGYKWQPGVRPHEAPALGELRTVYKSKAFAATPSSWTKVTLDLPMKDPSPAARKHLEPVRFFTVYIWSLGELFIDDVEVTRVR